MVPFADAQILGGYSDGVILVVRAGETRIGGYKRALEELRATPMLGTVLNGSHANLADGGRYYEKAYYKYYDKKGT